MSGQVWFDGGFILSEYLPAAPFERAWRYGDGGFETMLFREGKIPLLQFHAERATKHAEAFSAKLSLPSPAELQFIFEELAAKNGIKSYGRARLTWFRRPGGFYFPETNETSVLAEISPFEPQGVKRNLHALFYTQHPISPGIFSGFKKISAHEYVQASIFARDFGADDALMVNTKGFWTEFTSSNLLIRAEDKFFAPPPEDGAVEGILLNRLEEWLPKWGFSFRRKSLTTEDLREADEIYGINALRGFCSVKLEGFPAAEKSRLSELNRRLEEEFENPG
jgi:branched-chain amino acid aminotransferase